ncbi:MAG: VCBS repeat-containing protein [Fimbriimonadaceae bacterium]|nr:VCBS repeat-containing protein [Fimbriimonadaceae bacterium]
MLLLVALLLAGPPPPLESTALWVNDRPPVILAGPAAGTAAQQLAAALQPRLGVRPAVVATLAAAPLGQATVIALGSMLDNELLTRLYWNHYTFEDAQHPGPGGYTLHAVRDPYPWGGGVDVIVLGASRPADLPAACQRFSSLLQGTGPACRLPYQQLVEPGRRLNEAARAKLLGSPPAPSLTAFREHAESYLKTGDEAYATVALAALETIAAVYAKDPQRHIPWPEETTSGAIMAAWDAFDDCPLIPLAQRPRYVQTMLQWCRNLPRNSYQYQEIDEQFGITWNHTTFPLLGIYYGGRYFSRYSDLPEAQEWLRKARLGFTAQARAWKPMEDADGYFVHTIGHVIEFALAEGELRFLESGHLRRYADYAVQCGDDRQWPSGFGDSGYSVAPNLATAVLPTAFWATRDPLYLGLLQRVAPSWRNPFWQDVVPALGDRLTGLWTAPLDPLVYTDTQQRPVYSERLVPAEVTVAEAFDKVTFRESWEPGAQYLQLDGLGRGKHLHYDTNAIITFVQGGERWLLDHDYLTRNTTEHAMLSVLREGRCAELVPSLAALRVATQTAGHAYTASVVRGYNGVDWERRILWQRGDWFLVEDAVTARQAGNYDLELTWKTIDRGDQQVAADGRFTAGLGNRARPGGLTLIDDPAAPGKRVLLLGESNSKVVFDVALPPGDYTLAVVSQAVDGSSDSLWVQLDDGPPTDSHVPQGEYGAARGSWDGSRPTARVRLQGAGPHRVQVTLRERPAVRIDRFEFRREGAAPVVLPATEVRPPANPEADAHQRARFSIDPAVPVASFVTNHVRQGISVPVSVLHQRLAARLQPGERRVFASLLQVGDAQAPATPRLRPVSPGVYRLEQGADAALLGCQPSRVGDLDLQAAGWVVRPARLELLQGTSLRLGDRELRAAPAVGWTVDLTAREVLLSSPVAFEWTAGGATSRHPAGTVRVPLTDWPTRIELPTAATRPPAAAAAARPPGRAPAWQTALPGGGPVRRLRSRGLDGAPALLAAAGLRAHRLDAGGAVRWSYLTGGAVRDVATARFSATDPPAVLVSSADTWLYLLHPSGDLQRKQQTTGIYFSADHGERPWPVYLTRPVDSDGDGVDNLLVTTLGSMESWGLDPQLNKLWRRLAAYHGAMDLVARDLDGDGRPEILIGDKYGRLHVLGLDGQPRKGSVYTSIGDVAFDTADLDGDGRH